MQPATSCDNSDPSPLVTALLALGSNLGDRLGYLREGVRRLADEPGVRLLRVSSVYETSPVGGPVDQGSFLNAVVAVETDGGPEALLECGLRIEDRLGRKRTVVDGPRTLDIDLLTYGDCVRKEPNLVVPHPRMQHRSFVLVPLVEIAAEVRHPVLFRSFEQLLRDLRGERGGASEIVRRVEQGDAWVVGPAGPFDEMR